MLKENNKIIIVDDVEEDLIKLSKPFNDIGIGCRCFEYKVEFDTPLQNVRIAFFDINLIPTLGGSNESHYSVVEKAISQYIASDNGPYALIFWTNRKNLIEDIKKYINERNSNCPKPFVVDCIDKDEYLKNPEGLINRIESIFNTDSIGFLFEFENNATMAASKTISQIYSLIRNSDKWGESDNFNENFKKVLSKLAFDSIGYNQALDDPFKGIVHSFLPVLNYNIENNKSHSELLSVIKNEIHNSKEGKGLSYPVGFKSEKINSVLHIIEEQKLDKTQRGVVISIERESEIFIKGFENWFSQLLPGVMKEIRNKSKLIAIEISASCDYSQNKSRLNKYILGVITSENIENLIDKNRMPQYLYILQGCYTSISISDLKKFKVCLNLNYVFSALPDDTLLGQPLFAFSKEIMDQIGHKYASHVSRIGITSF